MRTVICTIQCDEVEYQSMEKTIAVPPVCESAKTENFSIPDDPYVLNMYLHNTNYITF
jgi:hypothetical protein